MTDAEWVVREACGDGSSACLRDLATAGNDY